MSWDSLFTVVGLELSIYYLDAIPVSHNFDFETAVSPVVVYLH